MAKTKKTINCFTPFAVIHVKILFLFSFAVNQLCSIQFKYYQNNPHTWQTLVSLLPSVDIYVSRVILRRPYRPHPYPLPPFGTRPTVDALLAYIDRIGILNWICGQAFSDSDQGFCWIEVTPLLWLHQKTCIERHFIRHSLGNLELQVCGCAMNW